MGGWGLTMTVGGMRIPLAVRVVNVQDVYRTWRGGAACAGPAAVSAVSQCGQSFSNAGQQ